ACNIARDPARAPTGGPAGPDHTQPEIPASAVVNSAFRTALPSRCNGRSTHEPSRAGITLARYGLHRNQATHSGQARLDLAVRGDARRAQAHESVYLLDALRLVGVESRAQQHLLGVERPALDEHAVVVHAPDEVGVPVGERQLEVVSRDAFVAEDRTRVVDRR